MEISIRQADPLAQADMDGNSNNGVVASPLVQNGVNNNRSVQPGPSSRPKRKATDRFHKMTRDNIDDL